MEVSVLNHAIRRTLSHDQHSWQRRNTVKAKLGTGIGAKPEGGRSGKRRNRCDNQEGDGEVRRSGIAGTAEGGRDSQSCGTDGNTEGERDLLQGGV